MNALVIAPRQEMLCKRCACVRVRMRAGEVLGMSAGKERSALAGGGWANSVPLFVLRRRRSGSVFFRCSAFRDLIDEKDIAHRAMCFWGRRIRITEHFVFQGASGAAAAAGPHGCQMDPAPVGGFWLVPVGFGGLW